MSEEERFEAWLQKVCERPMPNDAMERIQIFAKDLAEGAANEFWRPTLALDRNDLGAGQKFKEYSFQKWNNNYPNPALLEHNGYLSPYSGGYRITQSAFELVNIHVPANTFISYRRKDSSAFALLILKELKANNLEAFLDLSLEPGEDWHAGLKVRIQGYDYFILLLGKETLLSDVVLDEIGWAMDAGLTIIPVWHNGFEYHSEEWVEIPPEIDQLLTNTHAIRVREESALDYNTAIVELLNRFGVTP